MHSFTNKWDTIYLSFMITQKRFEQLSSVANRLVKHMGKMKYVVINLYITLLHNSQFQLDTFELGAEKIALVHQNKNAIKIFSC